MRRHVLFAVTLIVAFVLFVGSAEGAPPPSLDNPRAPAINLKLEDVSRPGTFVDFASLKGKIVFLHTLCVH